MSTNEQYGAIRSALGMGRQAEARALLDQGAEYTLPVAAGLGRTDDINRLLKTAEDAAKHDAVALAAINGEATPLRILVDLGADPNRYCPEGLGPHRTPLHHAVASGSSGTVCTLVTRGADLTLLDRDTQETAVTLARRLGHEDMLTLFCHAELMLPAFRAVKSGDVAALSSWLDNHPTQVNERVGDNPRTLLHMTADWPGAVPRGAESVRALVAAGAEVNVRLHDTHGETPLHWAASTDDIAVANALIECGADIDISGGCVAEGSPLFLAFIFGHWRVAERLLDIGAHILGHDIDVDRFEGELYKAPEAVRERGRTQIAELRSKQKR